MIDLWMSESLVTTNSIPSFKIALALLMAHTLGYVEQCCTLYFVVSPEWSNKKGLILYLKYGFSGYIYT
jgi:hypothetical protein